MLKINARFKLNEPRKIQVLSCANYKSHMYTRMSTLTCCRVVPYGTLQKRKHSVIVIIQLLQYLVAELHTYIAYTLCKTTVNSNYIACKNKLTTKLGCIDSCYLQMRFMQALTSPRKKCAIKMKEKYDYRINFFVVTGRTL